LAKTLYFDCFSGASGDMILGALLDLGLPLADLRAALGSLAVDGADVNTERVLRAGVSATKLHVGVQQPAAIARIARVPPTTHEHSHGHRHPDQHRHGHQHEHQHEPHEHHSLKQIDRLIRRSALSPQARDRAMHLFERLAEAEAAIHDLPIEKVHLHEVGALDSIVDIVGSVYGLEQVGADRIIASPLNVGSGTVTCAHGVFPVPAPATLRLLQGVPVYAGDVAMELVTPTGALLVTGYATAYGPLPPLTVRGVGYGAGDRDTAKHPNVLRLVVGDDGKDQSFEPVVEISCEIDDMNPQLFGPLMDHLHEAGALDVYYAPVQMKKNRPGILVTVLAAPERRERLTTILFAETTTIGVRFHEMMRERLDREERSIQTPLGAVRFKVATRDGRNVNASPEFDDCARIAAERGLAIKEVQAIAVKAWLDSTAKSPTTHE
jgi:uncharacterized protein (TIGR00299 family) protein